MDLSTKIRFFLRVLFYLPGTFLHEMAHYVGLTLMGYRNKSLSLWPKDILSGYEITMGTASGSLMPNQSKIRYVVPALLPKIYLVALYYFLNYLNILTVDLEEGALSIHFIIDSLDFHDYYTYLIIYTSIQLWWASSLSYQDIKMAFIGIVSLYGLILISGGVFLYYITSNHLIF